METLLRLKNGTIITTKSVPFASGGEGDLYEVLAPAAFSGQVLKLFKAGKRTRERERKIEYLAANPPKFHAQEGHTPVIWVSQIVYRNHEFAGFLMPRARGEKLELLCHSKLPGRLGAEWERFDLRNPESMALRQNLCYNIAVAVFQIHRLGQYVLADLKPDNIMVQPNGLISIIDTDSIEVIRHDRVRFSAAAATPDFAPPEFYRGGDSGKAALSETWDRFSLAVIFYRLLCGIHPFTGACLPPFEHCGDVGDKIMNGLFPHGRMAAVFRVLPPPHTLFSRLEKPIRSLFLRCFDDGHDNPSLRPAADDWCRALVRKPALKINRPLPSSLHALEGFTGSAALTFSARANYQLPPLMLVQLEKPGGLTGLLKGIWGGGRRQKLAETLHAKQEQFYFRLWDAKHQLELFDQIADGFQRVQKELLLQEESELQELKARCQSNLTHIDRAAMAVYIREQELFRELDEAYGDEMGRLESQLKALHLERISPVEQQHYRELEELQQEGMALLEEEALRIKEIESRSARKMRALEQQIRRIEEILGLEQDEPLREKLRALDAHRSELKEQEAREKSAALERFQGSFIGNQLAQSSIATDAYLIFNDNFADPGALARTLTAYGIRSAADFIAVNAAGEILTMSGRWVRIPHVARYRAQCLDDWRRKKLRDVPGAVPQMLFQTELDHIQASFRRALDALDLEEWTAKNEVVKSRAGASKELLLQKAVADQRLELLAGEVERQKEQLRLETEGKRRLLNGRLNQMQEQYRENMKALRAWFESEKNQVSTRRQARLQVLNARKEEIKKAFEPELRPLFKQAEKLREDTLSMARQVNIRTQLALEANLYRHLEQFEGREKAWKQVEGELGVLYEELLDLQRVYGEMG